jgi:hypothetical protein
MYRSPAVSGDTGSGSDANAADTSQSFTRPLGYRRGIAYGFEEDGKIQEGFRGLPDPRADNGRYELLEVIGPH